MAPAAPHPHRPLRFLCPLTSGPLGGALPFALPGGFHTKGHEPLPVATGRTPFPRDVPEAEVMRRDRNRIPVFRLLRGALRCLRTTLSKVLDRCGAVMEVLWSTLSRAPGALLEGAAPGAPAGGAVWEEMGPGAGQEWAWAPDASTLEEQQEGLGTGVKALEGDSAVGGRAELDLFQWLEWESCEEDEEPNRAGAGLARLFLLSPSVMNTAGRHMGASPLLTSEGEQEEEEEEDDSGGSDWSEDDWDDDDDGDCEGSEVDSKLWESFLRSDDPFNPFCLSSLAGGKGKGLETEDGRTAGLLHVTEGRRERADGTGAEGGPHPPQTGKEMGKKVRFSEEVEVRPLVTWAFARRAARDGSCWLEMARDRDRFRRRVLAASDIISPFLDANHRASVWARQ
ncbi:hypothetical protein AAFF_G00271630 [Aldrovandia affinis]|uniref:Protein phosphatase 1 regulatory subunit 15A/B C-terminal domain-containing protein n=1 Tax=Aldrovandia affinis TaxID=143900 RepID=A0AAD7RBF7_9TELE|nr:hypothetical protein AAFF_G00271630 [Aldrovandia affinis]